jgi:hypothetical protein
LTWVDAALGPNAVLDRPQFAECRAVAFPETLARALDTLKSQGAQFIVRRGNDGDAGRGVPSLKNISS